MAKTYSWKSLVNAADPDRNRQEIAYRFSGNRTFFTPRNPYAGAGVSYITDDDGEYITDSDGKPIEFVD